MGIGSKHKFNITAPQHKFNFTFPHGCNSPLAKPFYVEILALIGSIALLVLPILGLCRRRFSSTVFIQFPVLVGDGLSYALVSYTTGLMQSSTSGNELFIVWGICLIMLLASADSISTFSLQDSSKWLMFYIQLTLQITWVYLLCVEYFKTISPIEAPISILYIFCACKTAIRIATLRWVSGSTTFSLRWSTKLVADYMRSENVIDKTGDSFRMTDYNYIVFAKFKKTPKAEPPEYLIRVNPDLDKIITVGKIWRCRLLNSENSENSELGNELKDICLSFALAKLLCRRFFDYELAEKDLCETKALVFQNLLSQKNDDDPERAFRVIEVELSFIYDYFYSKYPVIASTRHLAKILSFLQAMPLLWLAILLFRSFNNPNDYLSLTSGQAKNYHALVTFVLVVIIFIFEYLEILLYIVSDWVKISLVSYYAMYPICRTTPFLENMIRFVCRLKIFKQYWQHKLGQYSLLDSLLNPKMNFILYLLHFVFYNEKQSQKQGSSIKLSDAVKKAILRSLTISNGQLSNGKASLERNGAAQLSEACNLRNHAQSILVWHIATTLCMQHTLLQQKKDERTNDNHGGQGTCCFWRRNIISRHINESIRVNYEIAISLSNYCAYLVAFAPKFLPNNSYDTEVMFDAVVQEANKLLSGSKSMHQIHEKMMSMGEAAGNSKLLEKGALLGKKLIEEMETEEKRWKVLADYWAEMILFIAPSSNAMIHVEKLAEGGELITHLWALLTHAGIIEREAQPSTA